MLVTLPISAIAPVIAHSSLAEAVPDTPIVVLASIVQDSSPVTTEPA